MAESYASAVVTTDLEHPGDDNVVGKVMRDFRMRHPPIAEQEIRRVLSRLYDICPPADDSVTKSALLGWRGGICFHGRKADTLRWLPVTRRQARFATHSTSAVLPSRVSSFPTTFGISMGVAACQGSGLIMGMTLICRKGLPAPLSLLSGWNTPSPLDRGRVGVGVIVTSGVAVEGLAARVTLLAPWPAG